MRRIAALRRMSVSVVIPTYNRIASLLDVLDALRRQTFRDFEVIVVEGPSTDGTADRLAALDGAIDDVRERFGVEAITRGVLLGRDSGLTVPLLPD